MVSGEAFRFGVVRAWIVRFLGVEVVVGRSWVMFWLLEVEVLVLWIFFRG